MKQKAKQRIDKSESYFVHVGYTFACESLRYYLKPKRRGKYGWQKLTKLKVRPVVKARQDKLNKYWGLGLL